jgi:uncharacterized protein with NRDE domain
MCLLLVAWKVHPRYPLVLAGNRDEQHARPAAPLGWWDDPAGLLAGRDLEAGGAWLGVTADGRAGVVTNFREPPRASPAAPSRGGFIPGFAASDGGAAAYAATLAGRASDYAGFNLLLADGRDLIYASNRPAFAVRHLQPGLYGLANDALDAPWPRVERTRARLRALLTEAEPDRDALFSALADTRPASTAELAAAGANAAPSPHGPFVQGPTYGTRCSTLLLVHAEGEVRIEEQSYDAHGLVTGVSAERFRTDVRHRRRAGRA